MKRILITGAKSYIGESVKDYLLQWKEKYIVVEKDTFGWTPVLADFKDCDVVFNVAGIAHIKETAENRHLYFDVNRDLVVRIAQVAKEAGVKQFILLSSMSVYGLKEGRITKDTIPNPLTAYGQSKLQADEEIKKIEDLSFLFTCLRPPMVYGKNCKGNYQSLRAFALKSPFFPNYYNQRSMIYIGNLCEFVKLCIDEERRGLFFPQNSEYSCTSEIVRQIASVHGKKIRLTKAFNWAIKLFPIAIVKKVFGNLTYEAVDTVATFDFVESIEVTEE